jgi:hypothetical protein
MKAKLVTAAVVLMSSGLAHAQDGPSTRLTALPSTTCFANTHADEALLRRGIEGLKNTSSTRTVWVTCSFPTINLEIPPNDDIRVDSIDMWVITDLVRVTMPCKAAVNIGSPTGDFVYFWGQATTNTERRAVVHIKPDTGRFTQSSFGVTCKIPQASTLTEFRVRIMQTNFIPME